MSVMKKILFLLVVLSVLSVPALAEVKRHAGLERYEKEGGKVEFLGNAYGLDAWMLVTKDGSPRYVYTTDQGAMVMGALVGPDGDVLSGDMLKAYLKKVEGGQGALPGADKTNQSKVERLYAEIEKANWVRVGDENAPYVYVFINVNCDHCRDYWKDLGGAVKSGTIQIRLVPFGAVAANREGGAALLSVEDPAAAWKNYMDGKLEALGKDKIKDGALEKIDANTALVKEWKIQGPPFTLYRKPDTGVLTALVGRPKNPMVVIADLMAK